MGSQLNNLKRTLRWTDFGKPRKSADPPPGVVATAAKTRATHGHSFNAEVVPGSKPHEFRLKDDVTVTVQLQSAQMFVNDWVFRQPSAFQDAILHHEQGHYDLVALFCRDMFIDIMALKSQTWPTAKEVLDAVQAVMDGYDKLIKDVHDPYDDDTKHGRDKQQQARWDGFITAAFTTARSSGDTAPDGTPYKVPLADTLRGNGVSI